MNYRYLAHVNGKEIVIPKIMRVGLPIKRQNGKYNFIIDIVGDEEGLTIFNDTLEESLIVRDDLAKKIDLAYRDQGSMA